MRVSAIGLGTWQFGAREWGYGEEYAKRTAPQIVRRALDLGINLIDTAELYGWGRSEQIIGEAIEGRRAEVFLATKLLPILPVTPVVEWRAVESAHRLRSSYLDCYQLHWPNLVVALEAPVRALRNLSEIGLVRHVGVSNFSLSQWQRIEAALGMPVCWNQVRYNLAQRGSGDELVRFAAEHDRLVVAYSPLAQGLLSGRFDAGHRPSGAARRANPLFLPENLAGANDLVALVRRIGDAHGATPAQVALAWLIRRPNVVAIPGASSVAQLELNAAAAELELSDDEDHELTAASDAFHPIQGRRALGRVLRAR